MKQLRTLFFIIILIMAARTGVAQPLEILIRSLPVFTAYAGVEAVDNILTVGVYSDKDVNLDEIKAFEEIRSWSADGVTIVTNHQSINIQALNQKNLADFTGQIIWILNVIDTVSLNQIKTFTENGLFTIGAQNKNYQDYIFATLIYVNTSNDPSVEKWRLTELIANCEISPLRFSNKLTHKKYFVDKQCD